MNKDKEALWEQAEIKIEEKYKSFFENQHSILGYAVARLHEFIIISYNYPMSVGFIGSNPLPKEIEEDVNIAFRQVFSEDGI